MEIDKKRSSVTTFVKNGSDELSPSALVTAEAVVKAKSETSPWTPNEMNTSPERAEANLFFIASSYFLMRMLVRIQSAKPAFKITRVLEKSKCY